MGSLEGVRGLTIGLTIPPLLHFLYKIWMALRHALGWLNSKIILGLFFMIILLPFAVVMHIIGYDPLNVTVNEKKT